MLSTPIYTLCSQNTTIVYRALYNLTLAASLTSFPTILLAHYAAATLAFFWFLFVNLFHF